MDGQTGRPPTARERAESKPPYESKTKAAARERRTTVELDDDELDDAEAIRQAMLEQRRQPVDLVNIAA